MRPGPEFYDQCIAGVDYAVCFIDYPWTGDPADINLASRSTPVLALVRGRSTTRR